MKKVIKFAIPLSALAFSIAQALTPPDTTIVTHYGTSPEDKGEASEVVTDANKNDYGLAGNIISGTIERLSDAGTNSGPTTSDETLNYKNNNIHNSTIIGKLVSVVGNPISNSLLWGNHDLSRFSTIDKSLQLFGHPYGTKISVLNSSLIGSTKLKQLDPNVSNSFTTNNISGEIQNSQINGQDTILTTSNYNHVSLLGNQNEVSACLGCDCRVGFNNINLIGDNNVISTLPKGYINNGDNGNTYTDVNLKNLSVMGKGNDIRYIGGRADGEYDINSIVLGNNNTIEAEANNEGSSVDEWKKHFANSVVLGHNNKAYGLNNVVIGSNGESAIAEESKKVTIRGADYNFAGATLNYKDGEGNGLEDAYRTVSFGKPGYERQLKNVAAGVISETSTDGINGSQLHAVIEAVNNLKQSAESKPVPTTTVGNGLELNTTDNSDGGKNYEITAKVADGLAFNNSGAITANVGKGVEISDNKIVAKLGKGAEFGDNNEIKAKIGDGLEFGNNGEIKAKGTAITAGDNITVSGDALNGYTINAKKTVIKGEGNTTVSEKEDGSYTITSANTQSVTKAGSGVSVAEANNDQGTKDYTVTVNTGKGVEIADNKVTAKIGDGLEFGDNGEIKAKGTTITAGKNVSVTGDALSGYTISSSISDDQVNDIVKKAKAEVGTFTDTNTQSVTKAGSGVSVAEADNDKGTKDYTVTVNTGKGVEIADNKVTAKIGDGLEFGDNGEIKAKGTTITAGKNVSVTGDALSGYTISSSISDDQINDIVKKTKEEVGTIVDTNTQSVTKAGSGVTVAEADNDKGTKDYTVTINTGKGVEIADNKVTAKIGDGLEFGENGEIKAKGTTITAGDNITVTGDASNGYTVNAKKTVIKGEGNTTVTEKEDGSYTITSENTQSTSSAGNGLSLKETNNANGTKNYEFGAKLGKGLHFDENGAIASNDTSLIAGDGIKVENTEKGTKISLGQDFKHLVTESLTTKSVKSETIEANSAQIGDIKINQNGIDMNNKVISNVADGVKMNDVATVGQVAKTSEKIHHRLDGMEKTINKNKKTSNAGVASVAAMANIPQVMSAGKSGVGVGVGHREGQNAIAVGFSRASDNAKHVVKFSAGIDSQRKSTLGAGYMFMW